MVSVMWIWVEANGLLELQHYSHHFDSWAFVWWPLQSTYVTTLYETRPSRGRWRSTQSREGDVIIWSINWLLVELNSGILTLTPPSSNPRALTAPYEKAGLVGNIAAVHEVPPRWQSTQTSHRLLSIFLFLFYYWNIKMPHTIDWCRVISLQLLLSKSRLNLIIGIRHR